MLTVAYLINQYPHVSHSFIRREIAGLEEAGLKVIRISVRRPGVKLVDPGDQAEERLTRVLLDAGVFRLFFAVILAIFTRPVRFVRALALTAQLARRSGKWFKSFVYLAEACLLLNWLRNSGVSHLHAHFGTNPADVAALCQTLGGPPFSFTVHGPEEFDRPESLSLDLKASRAAFVVAISSYGRSQLFRWLRSEDWPKVRVIRCGVDRAFLDSGPLAPVETPRFVCVGRLAEQKGQLILMEAATRLAADGVAFELILAGDGPMRPQIEAAILRGGLSERVRILGWASGQTVQAEIAAARAMVLPSFAEGLPVVLMESLALGRPAITTFVAGIPELVSDNVNGWLVPAGDAEALSNAMRRALGTTPETLATMGNAGAAAVRKLHDSRVEARKLADLFGFSARGKAAERLEQLAVSVGGTKCS